jgi:hypothetical protein
MTTQQAFAEFTDGGWNIPDFAPPADHFHGDGQTYDARVEGADTQYPFCHECAIGANELPSTTRGRALLGYLVYSPLIEDITHAELALVIEHIRRIEYGR